MRRALPLDPGVLPHDPDEPLAARRARLAAVAGARWADLPPDVVRSIAARLAGYARGPCSCVGDPRDCPDCSRGRGFESTELDVSSEDASGRRVDVVPLRLGAIPAVPVLSAVCRAWRAACANAPELTRRVDHSRNLGVPSAASVARACASGAYALLETIDLRDCPKVTDAALEALAARCDRLRDLRVSFGAESSADAKRNRRVTVAGVASLVPRLEALAASAAAGGKHADEFARDAAGMLERAHLLRRFAATGFARLPRHFVSKAFCSGPSGAGSSATTRAAMTHLDLSGSGGTGPGSSRPSFPWLDLMRACPAMEHLDLTGFGGLNGWEMTPATGSSRDPWRARLPGYPERVGGGGDDDRSRGDGGGPGTPPGWRELRVLRLGAPPVATSSGYVSCASDVTDEDVFRLAWDSPRLAELDATGCRRFVGRLDPARSAFASQPDRSDDPRDDQSRRSEWMRRLESARRESVNPDPYPEEATLCRGGLGAARGCSNVMPRVRTLRLAKTLVDPGAFLTETSETSETSDVGGDGAGWPPLREPAHFLLVVSQLTPRFPNLRTLELGTPSMLASEPTLVVTDANASLLLVARLAPNLVTLRVAGASVTDEGLHEAFYEYPHEEYLLTLPAGRRLAFFEDPESEPNRPAFNAPTRRCPRLETLDVASCRGLERGTRRAGARGSARDVLESARAHVERTYGAEGAWRTNIRKARMRGGDDAYWRRERDGLR